MSGEVIQELEDSEAYIDYLVERGASRERAEEAVKHLIDYEDRNNVELFPLEVIRKDEFETS